MASEIRTITPPTLIEADFIPASAGLSIPVPDIELSDWGVAVAVFRIHWMSLQTGQSIRAFYRPSADLRDDPVAWWNGISSTALATVNPTDPVPLVATGQLPADFYGLVRFSVSAFQGSVANTPLRFVYSLDLVLRG